VGGFGALHLAMLHPDVFGSVYALSPTLFDPDGLAEAPELSLPQTIADVVDAQARESVMTPENALLDMKSATADVRFSLAYAVAFAPDPARNPPYDYPYHLENGKIVRDQTVWDRWDQGLGGLAEKIRRYHANLLKLNGIMLDYGRSDADAWIPNGSEYFVAQLHMAGVPGQVLPYAGDHQTGLADRIRESMLPFFSTRLLSGNP
jgi:hypothetical protein